MTTATLVQLRRGGFSLTTLLAQLFVRVSVTSPRRQELRYPGGPRSLFGLAAQLMGGVFAVVLVATKSNQLLIQTTIPTGDGPISLVSTLDAAGISPPLWRLAGWVLWNAHAIPLQVSVEQGTVLRNVLLSAGPPYSLFLLLQPLLMIVAGLLATRTIIGAGELRFDAGTGRLRYSLNGSLHVFSGYFPGAFAGTILLPVGGFGPDILASLVGVVFLGPFIYGGIGGYIGSYIEWHRAEPWQEQGGDETGRY